MPEAGGQNELQRDPFKQVQTRVRPAREKGELLLEILIMIMTIVLAGEMFRGSEDQPECSRLQSLLRQPKVFGRCRRGAHLDDHFMVMITKIIMITHMIIMVSIINGSDQVGGGGSFVVLPLERTGRVGQAAWKVNVLFIIVATITIKSIISCK